MCVYVYVCVCNFVCLCVWVCFSRGLRALRQGWWCETSVSVVGVILSCVDFLAVSVTGCLVVLVRVHIPLVIVASCGEGHWVALNASMITCWSGSASGMTFAGKRASHILSPP